MRIIIDFPDGIIRYKIVYMQEDETGQINVGEFTVNEPDTIPVLYLPSLGVKQ